MMTTTNLDQPIREESSPAMTTAAAGRAKQFSLTAIYPVATTSESYQSRREDLPAHLARHAGTSLWARLRGRTPAELVAAQGLTGLGGGYFPVATKWSAVIESGRPVTVILNGAEGEPLSAKDAALLQLRPHQVLDGAQLAAYATRAREVVCWLAESATTTRRSLEAALRERRSSGFQEAPVRVMLCPDRYLSGESTAAARGVAGGSALPTYQERPGPPIDASGNVYLVHNAETLAKVAAIGFNGTTDPRLVTFFTGNARVVAGVGPDLTIGDAFGLAQRSAGLSEVPPQAVLLGGYGGQWVRWDTAASLPLHEPTLRANAMSLGAGIVAGLPAQACGVRTTAAIFRYLADSSARQCGPCMFGLPAISELLDQLAYGKLRRSESRRLDKYRSQVPRRGACAHPDGALRMLSTSLETFAADVALHADRGRCLHPGTDAGFPIPRAS